MAESILSMEERELFLGMLAHDIRQPLFLIKIHAQQAMNNPLPGEIQKHLMRIIETIHRVDRMTSDLLDYARTSTRADIPLKREEMCIHGIFHQIMEEMGVAWPHVKAEVKLEGDGVGVWDKERLYQIIANLVQNAAKHGETGSTIRIHSFPMNGHTHCVEVFNKGEKIPHHMLNDVFKPFKTGSAEKGTGLGLYITKYLVEMHGGQITVMSEDDGTTFKVCLPVRPSI